jgi:hypothetical protein
MSTMLERAFATVFNAYETVDRPLPEVPSFEGDGFWDIVKNVLRTPFQRVPISTAIDVSFGAHVHECIVPPVPVPVPSPSIEFPVHHAWPTGLALGNVKAALSITYYSNPMFLMKGCSNAGPLIPDITVFNPANPLMPIYMLSSQRKFSFEAMTVKSEGTPTALTQMGPIPLPLMTCGRPLNLPLAITPMNSILWAAYAGMILADFLAGMITMLGDALSSLLPAGIFPSTPRTARPTRADQRKAVADRFTNPVGAKGMMGSVLKGITGLLADLAKGTENPTYKLKADFMVVQYELAVGVTEPTVALEQKLLSAPMRRLTMDLAEGSAEYRRARGSEWRSGRWDADAADGAVQHVDVADIL